MNNLAMRRKLDDGTAVDLSSCPKLGPYYVLNAQQTAQACGLALDFCDAHTEAWIWSIGRVVDKVLTFDWDGTLLVAQHGHVLASTWTDLYQRDGVECLWLR